MSLFPRLPRGPARGLACVAAAGGAYVCLAGLLSPWMGAAAPFLRPGLDILFLGAAGAAVSRLLLAQARRLREANERLDSRNGDLAALLRREMEGRAAAENALRRAEARFRDMAEASSGFFWEAGEDLRLVSLSRRFAEETGLPAEGLIGRPLAEIFLPPDGQGGRSTFSPFSPPLSGWLADRRPFRALPVALSEDMAGGGATGGGTRRLLALSGRPVFDAGGAFGGYRGTGADITERRRQDRSAERLRRRQDLILESLGEGVFGLDPEGRITFVNPAAQEMLGWTAAELTGLGAGETLHPDPPDGWAPLPGGVPTRRRSGVTLRRKDGSALPVDYVWTAVMEDGRPLGAVVALRDITEQQRIDRELIQARLRAEAATRAKSDFLAHMSHELRTPLNSIIGFADVMRSEMFGPLGNDRYKEYLADIHRSGQHLLDLINDVVDLARIEAGRLDLDERPCDMAQLVDEALAMVRPEAVAGSCLLTNNVPGNLPRLRVDPRRMRQVLLHLLSNAVRFTPAEGQVTVQARVAADGTFRLEIRDTGIGIPAEEIDRVTQVFVQGNSDVAREKGGAGLGLPLAQQLVERHGGHLDIASTPGQGTTVGISLPPSRLVTSQPAAEQPALAEA